ncbi:MAG: hypothetical protein H6622_13775 [Halobacteriovoraceae bacterium]|nr:hypothetical protein [Halobacteriovoraceae bacterium]
MPKKVLIIDTDQSSLSVARRILENSGHDLYTIDELNNAVAGMERILPHLVILGLANNPQFAIDILKMRTESKVLEKLQFLVFCGQKNEKEKKIALGLGAVDYLEYPIKAQNLVVKVKRYLDNFEFPAYIPSQDEKKIELRMKGDIEKISEVSLILQCQAKFDGKKQVEIFSNFLRSIGAEHCQYKTYGKSSFVDKGVYNVEFIIVGADNNVTTNIRKVSRDKMR